MALVSPCAIADLSIRLLVEERNHTGMTVRQRNLLSSGKCNRLATSLPPALSQRLGLYQCGSDQHGSQGMPGLQCSCILHPLFRSVVGGKSKCSCCSTSFEGTLFLAVPMDRVAFGPNSTEATIIYSQSVQKRGEKMAFCLFPTFFGSFKGKNAGVVAIGTARQYENLSSSPSSAVSSLHDLGQLTSTKIHRGVEAPNSHAV